MKKTAGRKGGIPPGAATAALLAAVQAAALGGCASLVTTPAKRGEPPDGIRVYPPRVFLFVDNGRSHSQLVYAPDPDSAYDVKPVSFLAEHDFKLDLEGGQIKSLTSNVNPAAILALFREATDIAAGAGLGRAAVSSETIEGTFGLEDGIYVLRNGRFEKLSPLARPVRKPNPGERVP